MRAVLPLAVLCLACSAPVRELTVVPSLPDSCLGGRSVNQVKITALGDFPPAVLNVASAEPGAMARLELPDGTRVVQVEGLGVQGALVGFGRTAPLLLSPGLTELAIAYGPEDTLCPTRRLNYSRSGHRATLLQSGHVLISGGVGADGFPVPRFELYVTAGDLFGPAATFRIVDPNGTTTLDPRASLGHAATVLNDGSVLLTGGSPVDAGRASGIAFEGAQRLRSDGTADGLPGLLGGGPRAFHTATRLRDGRVLLVGGCSELDAGSCAPNRALSSTVIFEPRSGLYLTGPVLKRPRYAHEAISRGDGAVVLVGGHTEGPLDPPIELVDPNEQRPFDGPQVTGHAALLPTGALALLGGMSARLVTALGEAPLDLPDAPEPRVDATVTALEDGAWLVAGGNANNAPMLLYDGRGNQRRLAPFTRSGHSATRLLDGTVLIAGGGDPGSPSSTAAEIFLRSPLGPFSSLPAVTFEGTLDEYLPRRPDRVTLSGGGVRIAATAAGEAGRPAELALLPALDIDGLSMSVFAGRQGIAGAALIFAWQSDASYAFVTLEPGQPVRLMRVEPGRSGQSLVTEVCAGDPLADAELPDGTLAEVKLEHRVGQLQVGTVQRSFIKCTPEQTLGRGQVGVGALHGTVMFDTVTATR